MKKLFRTVLAVAVAAAAMTSCAKEMQEAAEGTGVTFGVTMQGPETKAVFGTPSGTTYPVLWQEGDEVKFMALKTPGEKVAVRVVEGKKYTVTVAEEGKKCRHHALSVLCPLPLQCLCQLRRRRHEQRLHPVRGSRQPDAYRDIRRSGRHHHPGRFHADR